MAALVTKKENFFLNCENYKHQLTVHIKVSSIDWVIFKINFSGKTMEESIEHELSLNCKIVYTLKSFDKMMQRFRKMLFL
jgi:hypothetical protein